MLTKRIYIQASHPDKSALTEAAELLRRGELVAFPTETVYGLGANALSGEACTKIFAVKGRPQDNPLIVHIARLADVEALAAVWPKTAQACAEKFWPGPLTLVLPKKPGVPDTVTAGLDTVAIRMPNHPVALALLEACGLPVAAPSANLSGKPSPTSGSHVWQDLQGAIPLILDAGTCNVGVESTVLDLSGSVPTILRPGGLAKEQLEDVLGEVGIDRPSENQIPRAPGMKYRHYAPNGEMLLFTGSREKILERMGYEISKAHLRSKRVGILCSLESAPLLHAQLPDLLFVLGSEDHPEEVAANLFEGLRVCDRQGIDLILAEGVAHTGLGLAVMNRLEKAAGQRIIRL